MILLKLVAWLLLPSLKLLNWWKSSTGSELAFSAKLATLRKHLEKCFSMLFNTASSAERKIQREKKPQNPKIKK